MTSQPRKDFELFCRALQHYSKRLKDIEDDDDIQNGNSIIKQDLKENAKKALTVAELLTDYKSENVTRDHIEMIKASLNLYKQDLVESGENLKKKLAVYISLRNLNNEVKHIEHVIYNRDWE